MPRREGTSRRWHRLPCSGGRLRASACRGQSSPCSAGESRLTVTPLRAHQRRPQSAHAAIGGRRPVAVRVLCRVRGAQRFQRSCSTSAKERHELSGIGLGHVNILPASPSGASHQATHSGADPSDLQAGLLPPASVRPVSCRCRVSCVVDQLDMRPRIVIPPRCCVSGDLETCMVSTLRLIRGDRDPGRPDVSWMSTPRCA